jgi:hypothetical protein
MGFKNASKDARAPKQERHSEIAADNAYILIEALVIAPAEIERAEPRLDEG